MLSKFLPENSVEIICSWIEELNVCVRVKNPRHTKKGDFKVINNKLFISINNNLNKYAFLITLTHELAHAFVFFRYGNHVKPHGVEWKTIFKKMLIKLMMNNCFPKNIIKPLAFYAKNPAASTFTDINLSSVLLKYNMKKEATIAEIKDGHIFFYRGKKYLKIKKVVKRIRCKREDKKEYLFHPLTKVDIS